MTATTSTPAPGLRAAVETATPGMAPAAPGGIKGCLMCDSLYVTANGQLPCWCDVGEKLVLKTLDPEKLAAGQETIWGIPELREIRRSYLEGKDPYDICLKCAVRGQGVATSLEPRYMRVLHVEPCYLCHLSCPQCIPADMRRSLKDPPFHMSLPFFEALLGQLRSEGVSGIRTAHFEGRGDPLMNVAVGDMVKAVRRAFPGVFTIVTSHGNYPFKPWLLQSGLDVLRLSVDGAFPGSYATYRIGGSLEKPLALMARLRDEKRRTGASLRVEWKYILFEWNDSDEEIRRARELATELDVHLSFCLTHSPGRSRRYVDEASVAGLRHPGGSPLQRATYQLRGEDQEDALQQLQADHVRALVESARDTLRTGDPEGAREQVRTALGIALGTPAGSVPDSARPDDLVKLAPMLGAWNGPDVLWPIADILLGAGAPAAAAQVYARVLAQEADGPDAASRRDLLRTALVRCAMDLAGDARASDEALGAALAHLGPAPSPPEERLADVAPRCDSADLLAALANLALARDLPRAAVSLFERYLEVSPEAPDRQVVAAMIRRLRVSSHLARAAERQRAGDRAGADGHLSDALALDPGAGALPAGSSPAETLRRSPELVAARISLPATASSLAALMLERGETAIVSAAFRRYLELAPDAPDREAVLALLARQAPPSAAPTTGALPERRGLLGRLFGAGTSH